MGVGSGFPYRNKLGKEGGSTSLTLIKKAKSSQLLFQIGFPHRCSLCKPKSLGTETEDCVKIAAYSLALFCSKSARDYPFVS